MKKRQLIALLLALTMLLATLAGCSKTENPKEPPKADSPTEPADAIVSEKYGPIYD